MKKTILIFVVFLLAGCGVNNSTNEITVCTKETTSGIQTKYEIESDIEDTEKIVKIVRTYEAAISDSMFERKSVAELEELYTAQYINPSEKTEGLEYNITLSKEDKKLTVIATIDTEKVDSNQLSEVFEVNDVKNVSKLTTHLEKKGFTCKKLKSE